MIMLGERRERPDEDEAESSPADESYPEGEEDEFPF
jgi:hypothetical protein